VGLTVQALVEQTHRDQQSLWTNFTMIAQRSTDHGDAFDSNEVWYYSPRSSLPAKRAELGDLHFVSVGGAFLAIRQRWSKILAARDRLKVKRSIYGADFADLTILWTYNPQSRGGTVEGLARDRFDVEVNSFESFVTFVTLLIDRELFDEPGGWVDEGKRKRENTLAEEALGHRRASLIDIDDEDSGVDDYASCDDEDAFEECLRDPESAMPVDGAAPLRTPQKDVPEDAHEDVHMDSGPDFEVQPDWPEWAGLNRHERNTLIDEFGDDLYSRRHGKPLVKPQTKHYIQFGWHHHPEVYASKYEATAAHPKYADLVRDIRDELSTRFFTASDGQVRREIEKKIFIRSNHGRNFPQKNVGKLLSRAPHSPMRPGAAGNLW
jgi:hypothetical protein